MSEIKCLVCDGKYFRKGYYEVDTKVDIYSTAHNNVTGIDSNLDIDIHTDITNEIIPDSEIDFYLEREGKSNWLSKHGDYEEIYKYACEDCGYIMSFTKEKDVVSKREEKKRMERERMYDWSNFKDNNK